MLQATPEALPLVKDDSANLAGVEWALGSWGPNGFQGGAPFHAIWDAINDQRTVARQFSEAIDGPGSGPENQSAIRAYEEQYSNKDYGDNGPISTAVIATARMLPYLAMDLTARAGGGAVGALVAGGEAGAAGVETGPGAAVAATGGAAFGAGVGQFVSAGLFNYYEALGPSYWKLINLKDTNGQPLDPEVAQALAQGSAVITGGLMSGLTGKLGGFLTKPLMARLGATTVEKALTDASVASIIKRGGLEFGKHWVTGATIMGAVAGVNQATVNAAEDISGQPFDEQGSVTKAAADGFIGGLRDMWLISAIGPGRELVKDIGRYRSSAEGAARLEAMTESANASKLLERSPELFQKAVEQMKTEKGTVKNVYVPVEEWTRYWQDKKLDPGEVAAKVIGDGGKAFSEAMGTKGDLAIPAEKYLKSIAKTEHAAGLAMDAKLFPDDLTPRQFTEERKAQEKRLEEEANRRAPELEQGKTEVRDFIREQAVKAGIGRDVAKQNADLVAEYVGTMALRLGVSVPEAATLGNLGGLRVLGPKGQTVAAAAVQHFQGALRPTAERFLESRLATMSPEARAQETFIDSTTGLRERQVIDQGPVPEGNQVAVITSPDVKGINDHPTAGGHNVANDMMRAVATGVGSEHPEAARGGTNFVLHVKDQADLERTLERARKATGNENLNLMGAVGENADKAFAALDAKVEQMRKEKALPERGGLNPKLDVAGLKFGPERAAGTVPPELVHEIGGLSDQQYAQRVYVDKVKVGGRDVPTGLLAKKAWEAIPRKANAAMLDMRGLKDANNKYGKETGNGMLLAFGDLIAHLGGSSFDATHLSGDEYALQHDDPVELQRFVNRLKERVGYLGLKHFDAATGKTEPISVDFRHGIGTDLDTADRALNTKKRAEVGAGDRGQENRQGDLAPGPEPRREPNSPQAVERGAGQGRGATRQFQREEVVAHVDGAPVTYESGARKVTETAPFRRWFGESKVVDANGQPQVVYHGSQRPDRIGSTFLKSRATSGPSAFFTDDPAIASSYSENKNDTSLEHPEDYSGWFKMKVGRGTVDLDQAWHHLTPEQRSEIAAKLPHVVHPNDDRTQYAFDQNETGLAGKDHWEHEIRQARGNVLKAAKEIWLNGGELVNDEADFLKVLELGGAKGIFELHDPHATKAGVYPVYLSIAKPLITSEIGPDVVAALEKASRRQREPEFSRGVDQWDKRAQSPSTWIERLKGDIESGTSSHAWTSIPDWVTKTLKGLGFDGIHDTGGKLGGAEHGVWIPFEPAQIKSATGNSGTFNPEKRSILESGGRKAGEQPRGFISLKLDPTGRPRELSISAFNGDKSTLMHEVSHFLSWSFHDIAESALATPELKADYAALLKWAGFDSVKDRLFKAKEVEALSQKKERTPAEERKLKQLSAGEERISHGFEQYLLEGKAPSAALATVFSKFRGWLMNIYRGLPGIQKQYQQGYGQEIGLSDDVRGIFARLLSQDEALKQARRDIGEGGQLPNTPPALPTASMTPDERAAYTKALQASRAAAEQEVARRMAELQAGQVGETRASVTREKAAELDKDPVNRAQAFLQHGQLAGADGVPMLEVPETMLAKDGSTLKLDRKAFVAKFGKDEASLMPPGMWAEKGLGVEADAIAPLLGFDDGQALVDAFRANEPRDVKLAKSVQDELNSLYGPALKDIAAAAMSAVHNEHTVKATLLELKALAKLVDPMTAGRINAIDPKEMRAAAQRLIEDKVVGDLDPDTYARAERRATIKAAALWGKDKAASLDQRIGRLFNQMLYRAARDAKDSVERVQTKLEGTSEAIRANMGKADPAYRDAHEAILAAIGMGKPVDGGSLDALIKTAAADGHELDFDMDSIRDLVSTPRDFERLTVAEARNVADAVTNIRHIAKASLEVDLAGKKQAKAAFLKELVDRVSSVQQPQPKMPYSRAAEGLREKGRRLRRGAQTLLEDVETWAEMLDGGTSGPAHRLLIEGRIEARTKENELTKKVLQVIKDKWQNVPKEIRKLKNRPVDLGDLLPVKDDTLAPIFTRDTLWSLFLNWGSEGNRQRIRDGNGWRDDAVNKALSMLTPGEAKFLQGVTDAINGLYPELAASHEKRTGLKLGKVDAEPITIGDETYPGGYHPLKYDSRQSQLGQMQDAAAVKDLFASSYVKPTLPSSHTKGRVEKVVAPVDLTWGTVPAHLSQVIRDISYGDWVRNAGSIMLSKDFKGAVTKFLGEERAKEFIPWLRDVANARADSAAGHQSDFLRRIGSAAKSRISLAVMGLNYPSLARHTLDPWSMMADSESISPRFITKGYLGVMNPANWSDPLYAKSKELANHDARLNDNLRGELDRIGGGEQGAMMRAIMTVSFKAHELVHHFTARVCFRAAYDQAIADGATEEEAVQRGDDVVRRALPSGDIAEKPPLLRQKNGIAAAVLFYGYASKMHNLRARAFDAALRTWQDPDSVPTDKATAIATVAAKWLAIGAVSSIGAYFAGRGWKKDENAAEWLGEEIALSPLDDIAIVGPAIKKVATGHKANVASVPELALLEQSLERIATLVQKAQHGGRTSDADKVWNAIEVLMIAMGPAGQAQRTIGYARKVQKREEHPRGPFDVAAGALLGGGDRNANPLESIQGALK
jgi:GGDEF domain-containing protein